MDQRVCGAIKSSTPDQWQVSCVIWVDWYDGMESGFIVLEGPMRIGAALERIGGSYSATLYHAWLVPDHAVDLISQMGEVTPEAAWRRDFTEEAPMEIDTVDEIIRAVDPESLFVVLDKQERRILAVGMVDRVLTDLPSARGFRSLPLQTPSGQ